MLRWRPREIGWLGGAGFHFGYGCGEGFGGHFGALDFEPRGEVVAYGVGDDVAFLDGVVFLFLEKGESGSCKSQLTCREHDVAVYRLRGTVGVRGTV